MESLPPTSRRAFLATAGLACAAAWLAPRGAAAAEAAPNVVDRMRKDAAAAKVAVEAVRGGISMLSGAGGNVAVLDGPDGKLLVDSGISKTNVLPALEGISRGPVRYVVNTHWHFDHTDGNAWLHAAGATIVAHENGRKRMAAKTRVEDWDFTFPPAPPEALPAVVFRGVTALHLGGAAVSLEPYAPAHTDTDVRARFPDADVQHVGDTWWNGHYPFIDYSTGGSIEGTIRAAEENVQAAGEKTLVIPGHGPVGGRKELAEYRDMLRSIRDAVAALKKQGKSADQVAAANPTAKYDAKWGTFVVSPDTFTRLVYAGV